MKEDIEAELKRKYDEIVVPDRIFDTTKIIQRVQEERRKRKLKIQRTVACVVTLVLVVSLAIVGVSLKINYDRTKDINNNVGATENNENKNVENQIPEVSGSITVKGKESFLDNDLVNDICIVEVKEIINYEVVEGIPSTKIEAHVLKNYANNVEGDVEMIVPGGVFTVKEIKKDAKVYTNEDIEKYDDDERVNVTCYNQVHIPMAEIGKTYLTTVKQDNEKIFICDDLKYGFKEYDIETNTMKDINGNSVEVEIDKYVDKYLENHKENK